MGMVGLYLCSQLDSHIQMPTAESQDVLSMYLSISGKDIDYVEGHRDELSKEEKDMDLKLTDEMLDCLLRDKDFQFGYELMSEEEQAHLYLLLLEQETLRTLRKREEIKTYK